MCEDITEWFKKDKVDELFNDEENKLLFYFNLKYEFDFDRIKYGYELKKKFPSYYFYCEDYITNQPLNFYAAQPYGFGYKFNAMEDYMFDDIKIIDYGNNNICINFYWKEEIIGQYDILDNYFFADKEEAKLFGSINMQHEFKPKE